MTHSGTVDLNSSFDYEGWTTKYATRGATVSDQRSDSWKATPIVFVHGTPWSSVVYRPIIEALEARGVTQILVYDLPGYGQSQSFEADPSLPEPSEKPDFEGETSVKFQAKALSALLEHTNFSTNASNTDPSSNPPPAIIAHDIAGAIVLRAHLIHNCNFSSMMLLDTNAVLPWGDGFYNTVRSEYAAFLKLPPQTHEAVVRSVIQSACYNVNVLKSGWEDALAGPWISSSSPSSSDTEEREPPTPEQRSFVRQIAQADDSDVDEMLDKDLYPSVRCNVKILWGEQDKWIPREKINELARRIGGGVKEMVAVPRAGHLVMMDQPERVAIEVFDWLCNGSRV